MMRAAVVIGPGGPERIVVREVPEPRPGRDEVLLRVCAASVNPLDRKVRRSPIRRIYGLRFPFIPGFDVAGVVEAIGTHVARLKPGDAVYGFSPRGGCHAEYVAVKEAHLALKPGGLSFAEAAALPGAGLTALQAMRDRANIQPGARVLINGASGGVGSFAVQIGTALGADVTAVASTANVAFVYELGARRTIDYTHEDFIKLEARFDVIFDVVPNRSFSACAPLLTPDGIYMTTLPGPGPFLWRLATRVARPFGYRKQCWWVMVKPDRDGLDALSDLAEKGRIRPAIPHTFPLEDAAAAHRLGDSGHARGKTVIIVDGACSHRKHAGRSLYAAVDG
jgi:NADPH:quinone reductase-like Zn-dependent oxidoreductase